MRRSLLVALLIVASSVATAQRKPPPKLEPLPEPPAPAGGPADPAVRIPVRDKLTVEEVHRVAGRVVAIKVTPPGGKPYFLVDPDGSGNWMRRDSLDGMLRVPLWLLHEFD
jgi:Protein of unknown function (DUF2782)